MPSVQQQEASQGPLPLGPRKRPSTVIHLPVIHFTALGYGAMLGGGILLMIALAIKSAYQQRPKETPDVFGDARFMNERELKRSGLLVSRQRPGADGVYIGAWKDSKGRTQYLRDVSNRHVLICGPTRSGKSVSCILPTLLEYRGATIVNDIKGELLAQTGAWRKAHIGPVIRWEPGALSGSAAWNPLLNVRLATPYEIADAHNIGLMLIDIRGHGLDRLDHWQKAAVPLLAGLILYELYAARELTAALAEAITLEEDSCPWLHPDDRRPTPVIAASLGDVALRFSDPNHDADADLFEDMRNNAYNNGRPHPFIAAEGAAQINRSDRERSGVTSTLRTFLTLFYDPIVSANTSVSDFRLSDISDLAQPLNIFIVTLPNDSVRLRPLVRLFLTMALRSLMAAPLIYVHGQPRSPHRHETLFVGDELPELGKLEEVETSLAKCASWGIKFLMGIQDVTQLNGIYGLGHSILANTHTKVFFPTGDLSTAKMLSESTGTKTEQTPHTTIMGRRLGFMGQVTKNIQATSRPLMTPGEILTMKGAVKDEDDRIIEPGRMLLLITGERPLETDQLLFFEDPTFLARSQGI